MRFPAGEAFVHRANVWTIDSIVGLIEALLSGASERKISESVSIFISGRCFRNKSVVRITSVVGWYPSKGVVWGGRAGVCSCSPLTVHSCLVAQPWLLIFHA